MAFRPLGPAALLLVGLAACTPGAEPVERAGAGPDGLSSGGLGAYLAGRFAQGHGDTAAAADLLLHAAQADPDSVELQQRAFTLLIAEARFDEAEPIGDALLAIDEDSPLPLILRGTLALGAGRAAQAVEQFKILPHKGLNAFVAPLMIAWAQAANGETDAALATLAPHSETQGFVAVHALHRGLIADLAGRTAEAETYLRAAFEAQSSLRAVEALGALLQRTGRLDEARALYARHAGAQGDAALLDGRRRLAAGAKVRRLVESPAEGLAEALFDTASLARQGNANDLSLAFLRLSLSLRADFPVAQLLLADVLTRQGRLDEANAVYRAMNLEGQGGDFARLRLALNLDEGGDVDGAVAELSRLAEQGDDRVEALLTWGDLLRRHKRFAEAVPVYDRAVELASAGGAAPPWTLLFARGIALERARQWPRAEADLLQALAQQPDQPDMLNYLGYTWVDLGINLDRGREMIERAVRLRPNDGAIVDSLGWALYRMGDYQQAVRNLERAVELKAEDPTINEHLGDALWRAGRHDEARFQWKRALSLDPEPEQIEPLKAKVSSGELPPASVQ